MDAGGRRVRILLIDDHPAIRRGVVSMLEGAGDFEVVGEADTAATALMLAGALRPDVVLLDYRLPGSSGSHVARRLRQLQPGVRIILLTAYDGEEHVSAAIEAGVDAYLLKSTGPEELEATIRRVLAGERLVGRDLLPTVLSRLERLERDRIERDAGLTPDEAQLLRFIVAGLSNREIAERCFWSEISVKRKSREIYRKLGAGDRVQAVAEAFRRGLA